MRISVYLNREDEVKLKELCKNYYSISQCVRAIINERHASIHDEIMIELQSIEEKLDQCLKQNPLNRTR
jgi:hypothetical protein